jgi:hypothetical protein
MRGRCGWMLALILLIALLVPTAGWAATGTTPRVAPVVGADFRISGPAAIAQEDDAAVAWNPDAAEYLAVWEDERNDPETGTDIYGRRIGADGSAIGEDFRISGQDTTTDEENPAITATGDGYLVVWVDRRKQDQRGTDIYGQRLSLTGGLVGGAFRVCGPGALRFEQAPAVAWNGTASLVVWSDGRSYLDRGEDIYGRLVSADGVPQGADFRISGTYARYDETTPAVTWGEVEFMVVWADARYSTDKGLDVRGRRVSATGVAQGKERRISPKTATGDDRVPQVASAGSGYLVVWQDERLLPGRQSDIYGRLLSASGAPDGPAFRVCGPGATGWDWTPGLAWDDVAEQYLVVWQDERNYGDRGADVYGRRVAEDGTRAGGDFRISGPAATAGEYGPAVAWSGSQHLVVWQDSRDEATTGRDIWGRRVELVDM